MKFKVLSIPPFDQQLKRLSKKYHSLKNEFSILLDTLETDPRQGIPISNNCYKIRLSIASKGKGKSGGVRVITNFVISEDTVFLISIYDKSEKSDLGDKEVRELLKQVPE